MMRRLAILAAGLVLPLIAFGVDLGTDFGLSNQAGPRYASRTLLTATQTINLGLGLSDSFYASTEFSAAVSTDYQPAVTDTVTASWTGEVFSAGLQMEGQISAGTKRVDFGGYLSAGLPLLGDIAELVTSVQARTDLVGWYGEVKLAPTAYLPLDKPTMLNVNVIAGFATAGFAGLSATGPTTLSILPHVYVSVSKQVGLDLTAGYTFDLSGGLLSASAGPSIAAKLSLTYGD